MANIGYETFVYLAFGILSLLPYAWPISVFVLNHLPRSTLSNGLLFYILYAMGVASGCIVSIARAYVFLAENGHASASAVWICAYTFAFAHIVFMSLWAIAVHREVKTKTTQGTKQTWVIPVNTLRSVLLVGLGLATLVVEWGLQGVLTPPWENLVAWTTFYFYIPYVVTVLATFISLAYYQWRP